MQDILGHQDISTTMNIYADVNEVSCERKSWVTWRLTSQTKGITTFIKDREVLLNKRASSLSAFRFYSDILSNILKNELVCAIIFHTVKRTVHEYTNTPKVRHPPVR